MYTLRIVSFLLILLGMVACANDPAPSKPVIEFPETPEPAVDEIPAALLDQHPEIEGSGQFLLVLADQASASTGRLIRYEKQEGSWRSLDTTVVNLGKSGLAGTGQKREGDGKTPSGLFGLGPAFGYDPMPEASIPFIQLTEQHYWISDPDSSNYNQLISYRPETSEMEVMRRDDDLYRYGLVVQYNTDPVVPGDGSAIFLHVQRGAGKPTLGCISMEMAIMKDLILWLDPGKYPIILLTDGSKL